MTTVDSKKPRLSASEVRQLVNNRKEKPQKEQERPAKTDKRFADLSRRVARYC